MPFISHAFLILARDRTEFSVITPRIGMTARLGLHCEDGAEPRFAFGNALIGLGSLGQWVGLNDRFDFTLRHVIQSFIKVFGAILLAADDLNALCDEVNQRD